MQDKWNADQNKRAGMQTTTYMILCAVALSSTLPLILALARTC
jgi:hypothetical protein